MAEMPDFNDEYKDMARAVVVIALRELAANWRSFKLPTTDEQFAGDSDPKALLWLADQMEEGKVILDTPEYLPTMSASGGINLTAECLGGQSADGKVAKLLRVEAHPLFCSDEIIDELASAMRDAALAKLKEHKIVTGAPPVEMPNPDEGGTLH